MHRTSVLTLGLAALLGALAPAASAQQHDDHGVTLHVNPRWSECSFQLDPSLTQSAWHQFAAEAGVVTYFRPLVDAAPMGRGSFEVSALQWETGIDDGDAAWNDTFVHPDSEHWLFEGDGLMFPGLTARVGVTDRTDVGAYVTKSPGANYGFYGAQVQHALVHGTASRWSAAARLSFVSMYGPEDLDFSVYGVDLVASRRYEVLGRRVALSPYVGVSASLSRAHEKSAVVDLEDESVLGGRATLGATAQVSVVRLGVEYAVSRVPSLSFKLGFGRDTRRPRT